MAKLQEAINYIKNLNIPKNDKTNILRARLLADKNGFNFEELTDYLDSKNQLLEMLTDEELCEKDEYTSEFLTELYLYSQLKRVVTEYQDLILSLFFS